MIRRQQMIASFNILAWKGYMEHLRIMDELGRGGGKCPLDIFYQECKIPIALRNYLVAIGIRRPMKQ